MGVQGLWKLLESTGRPVSLESLEGKVLAVDVSLWLHQAMRGMRDDSGNVSANAHLHVLFNRICKLLFYRIKPVFVFDGSVPELKRQTMVARRQRREIAAGKSKRTAERIIKNYLQSHALHAVMGGAGGSQETTAPRLPRISPGEPDMYELSPLPPTVLQESDSDSDNGPALGTDYLGRFQNLDDIDISSESFKSLPPEIQHEVIVDIKEAKKRNSWKTMDQLPKKSADFSEYQVKNLLQKGRMTKRIGVLRQEMTERNTSAVTASLDSDGGRSHTVEGGRIMSEDAQHYLLVKRPPAKPGDSGERDTSDGDPAQAIDRPSSGGIDRHNSEVKGHASERVAGQGSSSGMPWESDVIVIDHDAEEETDSLQVLEIAQVVKRFFLGQNRSLGSGSQERDLVGEDGSSDANEIICLDHGDLAGQRSDSEVEIVQVETRCCGNSLEEGKEASLWNEEVVILEDNQKDLSCLQGGQAIDQPERSLASDKINPTSEAGRSSSRDASDTLVCQKQELDLSVDRVGQRSQPTIRELSRYSSAVPSPDIISLDAEEDDSYAALLLSGQGQELPPAVRMDGQRGELAGGGVLEVSDESSDDDDFVEVIDQPASHDPSDELFHASVFVPPVDVSEVASSTSSQGKASDIHPPGFSGPRVDAGGVAMDAVTLATVDDAGEKAEPEADESDDLVDDEEAEEDNTELEIYREDMRKEWQAMNMDDVPQLQENLDAQRQVLQLERGKQDRVAVSITDIMYAESKELLDLFGLPYVNSPQEAEAQCAYLDKTEQTQGTISDDSDVWLFGGRHIYKNFFARGKDVECFKSADVEKQLFLDRAKLVTLAMLLGSDYTEGVKGVGWVTAMEILTEFPGQGVELLRAFKAWWDVAHEQLMPPVESQLKGKLRKLTLQESFPSQQVYQAYWSPVVDESQEEFSWQSPDLGLLRDFAKDKLGWTRTKADEALLPVMQKLNEKVIQRRMTSFLHVERDQPRQVTSKRLKRVLRHLGSPQAAEENEAKGKRGRKKGGKGRMRQKATVSMETDAKGRQHIGRGSGHKDEGDGDAEADAASVAMECEAVEDCETRGSRVKHSRSEEEEEDVESSREASGEEFTVSKRIKLQAEASESPSPRFTRRNRRTPRKPADTFQEEQAASLAEFLEIEEAVTRKTEGVIPMSDQRRETLGRRGAPTQTLAGHSETGETPESSKTSEIGQAPASEQTKRGNKRLRVGKGQAIKGRGQRGKGQRGNGKGHASQKGTGKAENLKATGRPGKGGPMLSESSSSDSDD